MDKMKLSSGDNSSNLQVGTYNQYGLSYTETRDICIDLIRAELSKYKEEAERVAIERNQHLLDAFFEAAAKEGLDDSSVLNEFRNPDMQYIFMEAQKAYIRHGTKELEDMLVELLIERTKEKERPHNQIILNEAITIVPLLQPYHIDMLSILAAFKYGYDTESITNIDSLKDFFMSMIPLLKSLEAIQDISIFDHLEYTKCVTIRENNNPPICSFGSYLYFCREFFLEGINRFHYLIMHPVKYKWAYKKQRIINDHFENRKILIKGFPVILRANIKQETVLYETEEHYLNNILEPEDIVTRIETLTWHKFFLFEIIPDDTFWRNVNLTSIGEIIASSNLHLKINKNLGSGHNGKIITDPFSADFLELKKLYPSLPGGTNDK